jgi:DNA-binding response OmpR family regulator
MPYKDILYLSKEIREKIVPIIFLTAKSMKEDVLKGYKAGADDYLNKPLTLKFCL